MFIGNQLILLAELSKYHFIFSIYRYPFFLENDIIRVWRDNYMENSFLENELLEQNTPIVFADGSGVYNELKQKYITHKKGLFIYGPSGVGKTYYIKPQKENNWIDGDVLWEACNAFPKGDWWNLSGEEIDIIGRRADVITEQAKKLGFWIIGASSVNMIPDAIVIPDFDTHFKYIKYREEHNYDDGIKSDDIEKIKRNREYFSRFKKDGVPIFTSVDDAVLYLQNQMGNSAH